MVVGFKGEFETMEKLFIHSFVKHLSSTIIGSRDKKDETSGTDLMELPFCWEERGRTVNIPCWELP